jgi:hypothetical protein
MHPFPSPPYRHPDPYRHPELVSGSISRLDPSVCVARWMLNQVQHDVRKSAPFYSRRPSAGWGLSRLSSTHGAILPSAIDSSLRWSDGVSYCDTALRPPRLCVHPIMCHSRESGNPWAELSAKWFAQRHKGTKRLLRVFVSSCELKSYRARQYRAMGSRLRGNDNVGVLGCVNPNSRRPSAGWGLSRLSSQRSGQRQGAIGSSLRWSDGVSYCDAALRPPRLCVHPIMCHSRESGNAWVDLSVKWFAQRR